MRFSKFFFTVFLTFAWPVYAFSDCRELLSEYGIFIDLESLEDSMSAIHIRLDDKFKIQNDVFSTISVTYRNDQKPITVPLVSRGENDYRLNGFSQYVFFAHDTYLDQIEINFIYYINENYEDTYLVTTVRELAATDKLSCKDVSAELHG